MDSVDLRSSEDVSVGPGERGRVPLPRVLRWFWIGSMAAFGLTLLGNHLETLANSPWQARFLIGKERFGDLLEYEPTFRHIHTAEFFRGGPGFSPIAYPPFGAVLYALLYSFGRPVVLYLGIFVLWLSFAVLAIRRSLLSYGIRPWVAILFPLSLAIVWFPAEGLLQRGNIELFVWLFTGTGVWAYLRNRDDAAAVLWGLAAATKLFPIVLLTLLLTRYRFRAFFTGVMTFAIVSFLSMLYLGPSIGVALKGSLRNIFGYQAVRTTEGSLHEFAANHSAFIPFSFIASVTGAESHHLATLYYGCGAALFLLVFLVWLRRLPMVNQLLAVTIFMVTLPPISYFYTLVHLYAPAFVLMLFAIQTEKRGILVPGLKGTILLFVPIFAAFTLFTYPTVFLFGGLIQSLLLFVLFLCSLQFRFEGLRADREWRANGARGQIVVSTSRSNV